jgi:hypothetical protein
VALALERDRPDGKPAIARLISGVLGDDFPYRGLRATLVAILVGLGLALLTLLLRDGWARSSTARPGPPIS